MCAGRRFVYADLRCMPIQCPVHCSHMFNLCWQKRTKLSCVPPDAHLLVVRKWALTYSTHSTRNVTKDKPTPPIHASQQKEKYEFKIAKWSLIWLVYKMAKWLQSWLVQNHQMIAVLAIYKIAKRSQFWPKSPIIVVLASSNLPNDCHFSHLQNCQSTKWPNDCSLD